MDELTPASAAGTSKPSPGIGSAASFADLVREGAAVLRYQARQVEAICRSAREVSLAGHKILAANTPVLQSEVGEELARGRPFGATWCVRADGKTSWSLRSREGGIDVSEVARRFGGGGHRQAAAFEAWANWHTESEVNP